MLVFEYWFLCRNSGLALSPLAEILPKLSESMDNPKGKSLAESVSAAAELYRTGKYNLDKIEGILGVNWQGAIEH